MLGLAPFRSAWARHRPGRDSNTPGASPGVVSSLRIGTRAMQRYGSVGSPTPLLNWWFSGYVPPPDTATNEYTKGFGVLKRWSGVAWVPANLRIHEFVLEQPSPISASGRAPFRSAWAFRRYGVETPTILGPSGQSVWTGVGFTPLMNSRPGNNPLPFLDWWFREDGITPTEIQQRGWVTFKRWDGRMWVPSQVKVFNFY